MSDLYSFAWHEDERIVEIALNGLWTLDDVPRYYTDLFEFALPKAAAGGLRVLTDLRGYKVQKPEVADLHVKFLKRNQADSPVTREAWIVTGVVQTMQFTRGAQTAEQSVNVFTDREAAWAYLLQPAES